MKRSTKVIRTDASMANEADLRPWYIYSGSSTLSVTHKTIAREWHPHMNGNFTPDDYTYGSNDKVWWLCRKCNEPWQARIEDRTISKSGCPRCSGKVATQGNNLKALFPVIAAQWHRAKNGQRRPELVLPKSNQVVWWQCPEVRQHEWPARVALRTANSAGCPFCAGSKPSLTNSLATLFPELAKQWHPTKNDGLTPANVTRGSQKVVWWRCPEGPDHIFQAAVRSRTSSTGKGCPMCHGLKLSVTNCLFSLFPQVADQWHPSKNGSLSPKDVTARSPARAWWKCRVNPKHQWPARIQDRTRKMSGCPECIGKKPRLSKDK